MAALVCDICGGKLVMGAGGIAVCDSCGMEYSTDRMKEKIQEVKGVVRIDNSHMIDNWMKMGNAAAKAGNHKEAYEYFTKVIEVDPENWRAIYEKGKAGAWQSTLANLRTSEIYQSISMALEILGKSVVTDSEMIDIKNEFAVALFNINNAITDLMDENLSDLDDKYFDSHWDQMWETRQRYLTNVSRLKDAMSLISDLTDDLSKRNVIEFKKRMCSDLRNACSSIQYWTDYSESALGYFGFSPDEKKKYLDMYWDLVYEIRETEPDFATEKWSYPDPFGPGLHMSEECYNYWAKIDQERQKKQAMQDAKNRYDAYWAEHAEEREKHLQRLAELDAEIKRTIEQSRPYDTRIAEIRKSLEQSVPSETQLAEVKRQQSDLSIQKSNLGFFAGKQKKQLQEQIDKLQRQIDEINQSIVRQRDSIQAEINAQIEAVEIERKPLLSKIRTLEEEKRDINTELEKER